jgi:Galactose oxidase, central domain
MNRCLVRLAASVSTAVALLLPAATAQSSTWTALPAGFPPRSTMASAWDPVSNSLVIFGGYDDSNYKNETWLFDGSTWSMANTPVAPPARAAASMAFDQTSQKLVLFGGFNGQYKNDTWLWDGATHTWAQAFPTVSPKAVTGPMLFTDPVTGRVDQYGGYDGQFYQLKTYRWTGTTWQDLAPSTSPWARSSASIALDPVAGKVVMFGGLASVNPWNTWTWNGSNWTMESPANQPPNRYDGRAAFDPVLNSVVVFGGAEGGVPLNDSWRWTGSDWVQLTTPAMPGPREAHAMAFVPTLGRIVIAGGEAFGSVKHDTWSLAHPQTFVDVGPGLAGGAGLPALTGEGDLAAGSPTGFTLHIGATTPFNTVSLFLGASVGALPFKGGTFYPSPLLFSVPLPANGSGQVNLPAMIPAGTPTGTSFVLQAWMPDAGAPHGAAATNGLQCIVP